MDGARAAPGSAAARVRAFPFLILAIGLVTIVGPSLTNATIAIGLGATPTYID